LGVFAVYLLFRASRQHLTLENDAVTVLVHKARRAMRRMSNAQALIFVATVVVMVARVDGPVANDRGRR